MGIVNAKEGFAPTPADEQVIVAHGSQLAGHFLIDREGTVRWAQVEASEGVAHLSKFPSEAELLAATRTLPG